MCCGGWFRNGAWSFGELSFPSLQPVRIAESGLTSGTVFPGMLRFAIGSVFPSLGVLWRREHGTHRGFGLLHARSRSDDNAPSPPPPVSVRGCRRDTPGSDPGTHRRREGGLSLFLFLFFSLFFCRYPPPRSPSSSTSAPLLFMIRHRLDVRASVSHLLGSRGELRVSLLCRTVSSRSHSGGGWGGAAVQMDPNEDTAVACQNSSTYFYFIAFSFFSSLFFFLFLFLSFLFLLLELCMY